MNRTRDTVFGVVLPISAALLGALSVVSIVLAYLGVIPQAWVEWPNCGLF